MPVVAWGQAAVQPLAFWGKLKCSPLLVSPDLVELELSVTRLVKKMHGPRCEKVLGSYFIMQY